MNEPSADTNSVSIEAAIDDAATRLATVSASARLDAELLVARAIDMPRSYVFAHPQDCLDALALERLEGSLRRRLGGEPIAYITGFREFWSLNLMVSPATLVPRPETERLVEVALGEIPSDADWSVLDLGTGCGAVALALALERRLCHFTAVDISPEALALARQNARQLELSHIEFREGDWVSPLTGRRFQLIVSNPPYVAANDPALDRLRAEPLSALVAGLDGLDSFRRLADESRAVISDGGTLILEHGAGQRSAVSELLAAYGWSDIECYDDLAGHPRVVRAVYRSSEAS